MHKGGFAKNQNMSQFQYVYVIDQNILSSTHNHPLFVIFYL